MIRVLLQYDDTYFVQAFSNYVSSYCKDIEFICFTTPEKALKYLSTDAMRLDAVLAMGEVLDETARPGVARLLAGDKTAFSDSEKMQINIYQPGAAILSDIRSAMSLSGVHMFTGADGQKVQVVAMASVQGGSGKTVLGYALAVAATNKGRHTLYVNLEPFPAYSQLYQYPFAKSIDEVLLALKGKRNAAPAVLDAMERNADGVMVLPPFNYAGDLMSLTQEDLRTLIRLLAEKTDLDLVIIDLPVGLQLINQWALEESTATLQVYTDDAVGREHMHRMETDMFYKNLPIKGTQYNVLNKSRQPAPEKGITQKFPQSDSLQQGQTVAEVLQKNPMFLKCCTELLAKIGG